MESNPIVDVLSSCPLGDDPGVRVEGLGAPSRTQPVPSSVEDPASASTPSIRRLRTVATSPQHIHAGAGGRPDDEETFLSTHSCPGGDDPPPSVSAWAERLSPGVTRRVCVKDFNAIVSAVYHATGRHCPVWADQRLTLPTAIEPTPAHSAPPVVTVVNELGSRPRQTKGGKVQGLAPSSQDAGVKLGKKGKKGKPTSSSAAGVTGYVAAPKKGGSSAHTHAQPAAAEPSASQGTTSPSSPPKGKAAKLKQLRSAVRRRLLRSLQTKLDGGTLQEYLEVTVEMVDQFLGTKGLAEMERWGKVPGQPGEPCYLETSGFLEQPCFTTRWSDRTAVGDWHEAYLRRRDRTLRRQEARPSAIHREYVSNLDGTPAAVADVCQRIQQASPQTLQGILGLSGLKRQALTAPVGVHIMPGPKSGGGHWVKVKVSFCKEAQPHLTIPAAHPSYSGDGKFSIYLTSHGSEGDGRRLLAFRQTMEPPYRLQRTTSPVTTFHRVDTVATQFVSGTAGVGAEASDCTEVQPRPPSLEGGASVDFKGNLSAVSDWEIEYPPP